jgi:O-antigen ligase
MSPLAFPSASRGAPAWRLRPRAGEIVALGAAAVLALALGWAIARHDGFGPGIGSAALLTASVLITAAVIRAGPIACIVAIVVLTITRYRPTLLEAGGVAVVPFDVFFVGLLGGWLRGVLARAQSSNTKSRPRIRFGQGIAGILFLYTTLTLANVAIADPAQFDDSAISWLRLVETGVLAFLAASMIETKRQVRLVVSSIVLVAAAAVVVPFVLAGGSVGGRFGGAGLGPNLFGLISGMVLLAGAFGAISPRTRWRIALVGIGVLGLVLAKSVASLVATGAALAVGTGLMRKAGPAPGITRVAAAVAVVGIVAFGALQALRPEATPGSEGFRGSTASQRLILGAAGFEIFKRNPVIGVGWRRSNDPDVIGDREVEIAVRRRFRDFRPSHFNDVFTSSNPTSVHNTYVQVLAELGLVGFALFGALVAVVGLRVRDLLRSLGRDHELWRAAWVMSLVLLLALVWLNDTPLFGGEPATVIPSIFIGTLAALARIEAESPPLRNT